MKEKVNLVCHGRSAERNAVILFDMQAGYGKFRFSCIEKFPQILRRCKQKIQVVSDCSAYGGWRRWYNHNGIADQKLTDDFCYDYEVHDKGKHLFCHGNLTEILLLKRISNIFAAWTIFYADWHGLFGNLFQYDFGNTTGENHGGL